MATPAGYTKEVLPPNLDATADPPSLFDGTTRLYVYYFCPYAQRTWIARNYKGLQEKIKLVPIDLANRPAWYKEKVYPGNKVPSLEHNNKVKGESLDLLKYIDENFEGPKLLPDDPAKKQFAEELLSYSDTFNSVNYRAFPSKGDVPDEVGAAYDKLEEALAKFDDGPFFLGQFSLVDIAYAPFIGSFKPFLLEVKNYDVTKGRPNLAKWIEELNKIDAYTATMHDSKELVGGMKKRFGERIIAPIFEYSFINLVNTVENKFHSLVIPWIQKVGHNRTPDDLFMIKNWIRTRRATVDIAYAPFIGSFKPFLLEVKNYDVTKGRPNLAKWIEELNKIDAYTATVHDSKELVGGMKKRFGFE